MSNKLIVIFTIIVTFSFNLSGKDLKYPVSAIPSILKENAHTVYREHQEVLEIKSEKSAVLNVTEVRTILNKNGEENGDFMELYDPMNKIVSLKGKVYDETGKQIKTLSSNDVIDHSYISDFSMYDDNRVKILESKTLTYPYTVEYNYEIDLKQTLFLPSWSHGEENTSYENSSYKLIVPTGYKIKYKEFNLNNDVKKSTESGKDIYLWSLNNLKARTNEPMASRSMPDYPLLMLVPENFAVDDSNGSTKSWKDLGIWVTSLIEDKDKLPEETVSKIKALTTNCKTEFEKIKLVYEYMQQKTRYVSIQVGIGGWQPFDATTVDKYSYGDCKALSNYTKALLSAAGIKSFYTLVYAGSNNKIIDESFPSSQFNHVIVCVPLNTDTVWLECTNQRMPCGYTGDFTDDRKVFLIDGENSRLIHSRIYPVEENCTNRVANVKFNEDLNSEAIVNTTYKGLCYDEILPVYYADNADKLKIVTQRINLPSFTLSNFKYTENRCKTPSFNENLNLIVTNYIHKLVGDVALLPLNFMNKLTTIPEKVRNRKSEMSIRRPVMENDTIVYELPKNIKITNLPEKKEITNKYGKYTTTAVADGTVITYTRHFELYKGTFPASDYSEFRDFLEQISTADNDVASLKLI